MEHWMNNIDK